jgi:lipopolysaccharide transport system ATP-binding protein
MSKPVIAVENLSKSYQLGQIDTGTFSNDLKVWWSRIRGKPNPLQLIDENDHGNQIGEQLWALQDVSFQLDQGEVLGIIGSNGAGKSTILKILSRVTAPTSGCVKIKGRIASLLEVGTGFHPELTGRENIYLNGAILGMTNQEVNRKFDEIVSFAEIEKFIDTPVKRYSSGMYVRLAFAVAANLEQDILIVDEVLAVGDIQFQKKCLGKMEDVAHNGRTVLFVSHNLGAIKQLCTKAILLEKGKLIESGHTENVIASYSERSTNTNSNSFAFHTQSSQLKYGIKEIEFIDSNGEKKGIIQTGDEVKIKAKIFSHKTFTGLVLTYGINDEYGNRLCVLHSKLSGYSFNLDCKETEVICRISKLTLLPGQYTVDIKIYKSINDPIIWLPRAIEIRVEDGEFQKNGKLPPKEWGGVFAIEQDWYEIPAMNN